MKSHMKKSLYALFPFIGLVAVLIIFFLLILSFKGSGQAFKFINFGNLKSMVAATIIVGIGAMGMTIIIISGGIDLSVGSQLALGSVALAVFMVSQTNYYVTEKGSEDKYLLQNVVENQDSQKLATLADRLRLSKNARIDEVYAVLKTKRRDIPKLLQYADFNAPNGKSVEWSKVKEEISTMTVMWSVLVAVAVCALCGLLNGAISVGFGIVPFIVTLGMMQIARGFAKMLSGQSTVGTADNVLKTFTDVDPKPAALLVSQGVWIMIIVTVLLAIVLKYTVFGRYVYAIGSNENTAKLCGINVTKVRILIYTIGGALTGIASVMQYANVGSGIPNEAVGKELDIIAAVVIGGGSLNGGEGSAIGSLAGALVMSVLRSGCTYLEVPDYVQNIIVGSIIILAVGIDKLKHRKAS